MPSSTRQHEEFSAIPRLPVAGFVVAGTFLLAGLISSIVGMGWLLTKFGIVAGMTALLIVWIAGAMLAFPLLRSRDVRTPVTLCIVTIVLIRIFMIWVTGGANATHADPLIYQQLATRVLNGEGLVWYLPGFPEMRAVYPPLYPLLLAVAYWLTGNSLYSPMLLNLTVNLATAAVLWKTGSILGSRRGGLVVAYLYLIWPSVVVASSFPTKEGLVGLLTALIVAIAADTSSINAKKAAAYGATTALLALTQPAFVTLPALIAIVIGVRVGWERLLWFGLVAAVAGTVVMLPWWIRNWLLFERFVPLTTGSGLNLYVNTIGWHVPPALRKLGEVDLTTALMTSALQGILADPLGFLIFKLNAWFVAFGLDHAHIETLQSLDRAPRVEPTLFTLVTQVPLIALWGVALWATFKKTPHRAFFVMIVLCCLVQFAIFNSWFEFGQRHRAYLLPIILAWFASCIQLTQQRIVGSKNSQPCRS